MMTELRIECARCGAEMLAQVSRTVENNEMEVCSRCEWQMRCEEVEQLRGVIERLEIEKHDLAERLAEVQP